MTWEELREEAHQIRLEYQAGHRSYADARKALQAFIREANRRADAIAEKYQQKSRRIRVGDFLRGPL